MSFISDYTPTTSTFFDVADGDHTMTIKGARITRTTKGTQIIEVGCMVGSCPVVYVEKLIEGEYFDKVATMFFDAFKIPRGNFNFNVWVGKSALGHFVHSQESYVIDGVEKTINKAVRKYYIFENQNPASTPAPVAAVVHSTGGTVQQETKAPGFDEDIPW